MSHNLCYNTKFYPMIFLSLHILIMWKKYIISIDQSEGYPFDGPKQGFDKVIVRTEPKMNGAFEFKQKSEKLQRLVKLESPYLIQIIRVQQQHKVGLKIDYQFVPDCLKKSSKIYEISFLTAVKEKLHQLFDLLASNLIKTDVKIDNIGLTADGEPKMFLGLNFELIHQGQHRQLGQQYQVAVDRMLQSHFGFRNSLQAHSDTQVSQHSQRLDRKLSEMEGKLNRLKLKNPHSSQESSNSSKKQASKDKNLVLQSVSSKQSNSSCSGGTSHSVIAMNQAKTKIHKSSFGDYSTTSYRLNEQSMRQDSLKKRVSTALTKTQQAFKIYEKYSRRKRRI